MSVNGMDYFTMSFFLKPSKKGRNCGKRSRNIIYMNCMYPSLVHIPGSSGRYIISKGKKVFILSGGFHEWVMYRLIPSFRELQFASLATQGSYMAVCTVQ
jgi:hypothetical protein